MHCEYNNQSELRKQCEGVPEPYHYYTSEQEPSIVDVNETQIVNERVNQAEEYAHNNETINNQSDHVHEQAIDYTKAPKPILSNAHNTYSTMWKPHFVNAEKEQSSVTPLHTPRSRLERAAENTPVSTKSSRSNSIARERSKAAEDAVEIMLDRARTETTGTGMEWSNHVLQKQDTCHSDEDSGNVSYKIGSNGSANSSNNSNVWITNAIDDVNTCNEYENDNNLKNNNSNKNFLM